MLVYHKKRYDEKLEFRTIISEFVFPLLGIFETDLQYTTTDNFIIQDYFYFYRNKLYFFPSLTSSYGYFIPVNNNYKYEENFEELSMFLSELVEVSYNHNKEAYNSIEEVFAAYTKIVKKYAYKNFYPENTKLINTLCNHVSDVINKQKEHSVFTICIDFNKTGNPQYKLQDVINPQSSLLKGANRSGVVYFDKDLNFINYVSLDFHSIQRDSVLTKLSFIITQNNTIFFIKDGVVKYIKRNAKISSFSKTHLALTVRSNKKTNKLSKEMLTMYFYIMFDTLIDSNDKYIHILNTENEPNLGFSIFDYFKDYNLHKRMERTEEFYIDKNGYVLSLEHLDIIPLLSVHTHSDGQLDIFIEGRKKYNLF